MSSNRERVILYQSKNSNDLPEEIERTYPYGEMKIVVTVCCDSFPQPGNAIAQKAILTLLSIAFLLMLLSALPLVLLLLLRLTL